MDRKRRSVRLPEYDYASPGAYLVTICTAVKSDLFGNVLADGTMELNGCGRIVREEWLRTAELRTNVDLDEYVIMPDHFHGIVIL
ncbi:transposase, partial [bacterium]|nr:transposase [bacterium]